MLVFCYFCQHVKFDTFMNNKEKNNKFSLHYWIKIPSWSKNIIFEKNVTILSCLKREDMLLSFLVQMLVAGSTYKMNRTEIIG